ncbi:hypothetical protein FY528_16585 [Hymenobacter lutimineralis]|uniref:PorT family protein n=1 Tax=Hymenobacter lutimineralis TaxID=2606448 RepID=A0A5D6UWU2_9BACT|nr:hypothetical protein [Hymenobacter lutimineralis]TYZ06889.1 hypothetical protein FY528_16585 [Hymenobacter lutimineralis]
MKLFLPLLLGLLGAEAAQAQLKLGATGLIAGYTTLKVDPRLQMVGRFPVYIGDTDMDNIRVGAYTTFQLPHGLQLRPEVSYVNHSIWMSAWNPDMDPMVDDANWIMSTILPNYKRAEVAPLVVKQFKYWQLHTGLFGWYRLPDPNADQVPSPRPNRYIFYDIEQGISPFVGGFKLGGGLTLGRLHADVNYSRTLTSITKRTIMHNGVPTPFFPRLHASSFTYDLRFDLYKPKE